MPRSFLITRRSASSAATSGLKTRENDATKGKKKKHKAKLSASSAAPPPPLSSPPETSGAADSSTVGGGADNVGGGEGEESRSGPPSSRLDGDRTAAAAAEAIDASIHGNGDTLLSAVKLSTSEVPTTMYEVVRADHDYLELMVKVKEELEDEVVKDLVVRTVRPLVTSIKCKERRKDAFFNLSQLAEVSLAAEGKSEDKDLSKRIREAREQQRLFRQMQQRGPPLGTKTMQIVVPENASHIIICTNNNVPKQQEMTAKRKARHQSYNCFDCGKKYSTSSNLARHRQTHRSLQDKKAKKCPFCSKIYVSMPAFSMHLRTHNQTCKCTICDKAFSRPWLLQGHIRTHTGERPFPCYLCSKAFADKSNLRAHIQTHSNAKPFACKKCGKTFALKSYLYKHEESACNTNIKFTH